MDRESQSLAINYIVLVLLLLVLWILYTNVSLDLLDELLDYISFSFDLDKQES